MRRILATTLVVILGLVALRCGDDQQSLSPPVSAAKGGGGGGGTSCAFNSFNTLVNRYFPSSTERTTVKAMVDAMQSAGAFTTTAQDSGFSVLAHIAANVDAGNADSVDGSALANATLACMYNDPAALPETFPENFLTATDPSATGAFQVRGRAQDGATARVLNRPYSAPFSVVAPPTGSDWATVLSGNAAPRRILVYGRAGGDPFTYDWKVIPRTTAFDPQVTVGVCTDAEINASSMLNEEHVGMLTFVLVGPDLLPANCAPQVALRTPSRPFQLARRVTHSLFDVQPAWALLGGVGGSTGGIHSKFSALALFGVNIAFTVQPPANATVCGTPPCGDGFSMTVQATSATPAGTFTVGGTTLHLQGVNNNGTPTEINQCIGGVCTNDPVATTDNAGVATFTGISVTKTGAIKFVVTNGSVNGRAAITVGSATSNKTNVKP